MRKLFAAAGIAVSLIYQPASVQAKDEPNLVLEELLVTATRRVESLQDVAMSVSAFSGDFLLKTGANDLTQLEEYTPNLKITPGADTRSTSIRIRGIGSVGTNSGIDPSVGVFLDGVYQGRAGMALSDLVDVERVEILRGPQGTLYGKNTAAGAITVTTKMPGQEFESLVELGYDSNAQAELRGSVNIPLGDSGHAMRLAGFVVEGDHLYNNTWTGEGINNTSKWGARGRFLLDGQDTNLDRNWGEFVLTADYTSEDTDCCAFAISDYNGLSTLNAPLTNDPSRELQQSLGMNDRGKYILQYNAFEDTEGYSPPKADPFGDDYWFDGDLGNKVDVGGLALEWIKDLPSEINITFLNAWRHYESDSQYDGDFTAYSAVQGSTTVELDQYSTELRFTSPGAETFDWVGGLYAYYSEFDSVGTFGMREPLVDNINLGFFFPDGSLNTDSNLYTTTSYAAFGQVVWNATDEFSATLGLRYTYEKKQREGSQITEPSFFLDVPPVAGPDLYYDDTRSDSDLSPTINLRYFFTQDIMGYASISRGFKSGGYNQLREVSDSNGEFDEEIATNYELGWKGTFFNQRLQFNGTFFLVEYDNFQSQTFDGSSIRVTNAGTMESYGAEIELMYLVAENLTLGSNIGYNKAEYSEFENGQCTVEQAFQEYYITGGAQGGSPGTASVCTQDLAGKPLDNAPELTVSTFLQWDREIGDSLWGSLRFEHSYIDEYFLDQDLDKNLVNEAVNLINVRLSLSNIERDWEAVLWGRNLLDEEYYAFGIDIPTVGGYAGIRAPQATVGVTVRFFN